MNRLVVSWPCPSWRSSSDEPVGEVDQPVGKHNEPVGGIHQPIGWSPDVVSSFFLLPYEPVGGGFEPIGCALNRLVSL